MTLATVRMARDDVTRAHQRVNTLSAAEPTMKIPAISPPRRRTVSIPSSCHAVRGCLPARRLRLNGDPLLGDESRQFLGHRRLVLGRITSSGRRLPATLVSQISGMNTTMPAMST